VEWRLGSDAEKRPFVVLAVTAIAGATSREILDTDASAFVYPEAVIFFGNAGLVDHYQGLFNATEFKSCETMNFIVAAFKPAPACKFSLVLPSIA